LDVLAVLLFLRPGFQGDFLNVRSRSVAADIPPAITTSDSVETRLGTLKFFDGFPDDAHCPKGLWTTSIFSAVSLNPALGQD
jgi:hypothetical protein